MTKNTGVGRGNNPQSHKNTKRGADHCRWNSQQLGNNFRSTYDTTDN